MIENIRALAAPALMQRLTLLVNHLLSSEPIAMARMRAHAGRRIDLQLSGWPAWLPAWPQLDFRVTPAGLFEWCGEESSASAMTATAWDPADLTVSIGLGNPAAALFDAVTGQRPRVDIAGDAAFAADVDWLFENLRWDIEDDLARVVGATPARFIARAGRGVAGGLREAVRLAGRVVPGGASARTAGERDVPPRA